MIKPVEASNGKVENVGALSSMYLVDTVCTTKVYMMTTGIALGVKSITMFSLLPIHYVSCNKCDSLMSFYIAFVIEMAWI